MFPGSCSTGIQYSSYVAVVEGNPDPVLFGINAISGGNFQTTITCTPLRSYENFSKNILKVDEDLQGPSPRNLDGEGLIYYSNIQVSHKGKQVNDTLI